MKQYNQLQSQREEFYLPIAMYIESGNRYLVYPSSTEHFSYKIKKNIHTHSQSFHTLPYLRVQNAGGLSERQYRFRAFKSTIGAID